jgi:hypothetical protein
MLADQTNAREDTKAILKELIVREERRIGTWASNVLFRERPQLTQLTGPSNTSSFPPAMRR